MQREDEPFDFDVDLFDTRDLVDRIGWLEAELDDELYTSPNNADEREELEHELKELRDFAGELENYAGDKLSDGNTVIADDHFEDYARELAEEIGAIDPNAAWPLMHIDWEAAAESLQIDYSEIDFNGKVWWVR